MSPCGSCNNRRFGEMYRFYLQVENNQRTKNTLAAASDCSTLRIINYHMRKEAIEWDILNRGREKELLQWRLCRRVFPLPRIYTDNYRPLFLDLPRGEQY
jgi:hypothetical protein